VDLHTSFNEVVVKRKGSRMAKMDCTQQIPIGVDISRTEALRIENFSCYLSSPSGLERPIAHRSMKVYTTGMATMPPTTSVEHADSNRAMEMVLCNTIGKVAEETKSGDKRNEQQDALTVLFLLRNQQSSSPW
jgi:hypothetical protein